MGFLDMFKSQECALCGGKASPLTRKKLRDGAYICQDCEKNASAFLDISKLTKEELDEHIEYMKKQDILYKKEFEKAEKREVFGVYKIAFADSIGMFELSRDKTKNRPYKELFRYDAVEKYEPYYIDHISSGPNDKVAYDRAGVYIYLYCNNPNISLDALSTGQGVNVHPYVRQLDMRVENRVDLKKIKTVESKIENIIRGFDKAFGQDTYKPIFGNALSQKEAKQIQAGADIVKGLGKAAKGAFKGEGIKEGLENAAESAMNIMSGDRIKSKKLADEAEKRAWEE